MLDRLMSKPEAAFGLLEAAPEGTAPSAPRASNRHVADAYVLESGPEWDDWDPTTIMKFHKIGLCWGFRVRLYSVAGQWCARSDFFMSTLCSLRATHAEGVSWCEGRRVKEKPRLGAQWEGYRF